MPSLHAFIQESDPVHQKGGRGRHLGGERLSSVSPHTKGKLLSEVGFEPTPPERLRPERSALDRSAILTAWRANLERVRARSGLYRSCSKIRPPSEAQRDALSGTNPLALEWTFYSRSGKQFFWTPLALTSRERPAKSNASFEPESNQRPKDVCLFNYSPPLYQLSYRRS